MQLIFLLMLAICALGTALPQNKIRVDIEKEDTSTTTTAKPESKLIKIESSHDLKTRISGAGEKLVIIFFSATWCPRSRGIAPTVKNIANTMDNVIVLEVDVDIVSNYRIVNEYDVNAIPTFVFLKNSEKLKKYASADVDELRDNIRTFS